MVSKKNYTNSYEVGLDRILHLSTSDINVTYTHILVLN